MAKAKILKSLVGHPDPAHGPPRHLFVPELARYILAYQAENESGDCVLAVFCPNDLGCASCVQQITYHERDNPLISISPDGKTVAMALQDRREGTSCILLNGRVAYRLPYDMVSDLAWIPDLGLVYEAFNSHHDDRADQDMHVFLDGKEVTGALQFQSVIAREFPQTMGVVSLHQGVARYHVAAQLVKEAPAKDWDEARNKMIPPITVGDMASPCELVRDEERQTMSLTVRGFKGPDFYEIEFRGTQQPEWSADGTRWAYVGKQVNAKALQGLAALIREAEAAEETQDEGDPDAMGEFNLTEEQLAKAQETGKLPGKMGKLMRVQQRVQSSERFTVMNGLVAWPASYRSVHGLFFTPQDRLVALVADTKGQRVVMDGVPGPRFDVIDAIRPTKDGVTYVGLIKDAFWRVYQA